MADLRDETYLAAVAAVDGQPALNTLLSRGDRRRLVTDAAVWYLAQHDGLVSHTGTCVVLTAGPPGAGKTTVRELAVADLAHRRVLDSDIAKRYLASWCVEHGLYGSLSTLVLPDGRPLQPLGLAPLLQTVSTEVINAVRHEAFATGEDVVIEATLASPSYGERLLLSLAKAEYTDLLVVSAETTRAEAHERVRDRWWLDRCADPLGGRLVGPETVDLAYAQDDAVSVCRAHAIALVERVRAGESTLDRASLVAYDDGKLAFADSDPPRLVK